MRFSLSKYHSLLLIVSLLTVAFIFNVVLFFLRRYRLVILGWLFVITFVDWIA